MDTSTMTGNDISSKVQSQSCSEDSTEVALQTEEMFDETSSQASDEISSQSSDEALSRSSSRTSMTIHDAEDEAEDEESQDSDTDSDTDSDGTDFDYSYYHDRDYDSEEEGEHYRVYDDDYVEPELQHPRCIYQDIRSRCLDINQQNKLSSAAGLELHNLMTDALAKNKMLFEFRQASQPCRTPDMAQEQWEQQLSTTYRRQTQLLLEALEADIAYFRKALREMVQAYFENYNSKDPPSTHDYEEERERIHHEVGDTRANILVVRLRADRLLERFLDLFRRKTLVKEEDWACVDQLIPTWRTPHTSGGRLCSNDWPERVTRTNQERQRTASEAFAQWGWERARRVSRGVERGWLMGQRFIPLDEAFVDSFIPPCLSEPLLQHLFGGAAPDVRSPENMLPDIPLGVLTGVMAPAIANDEVLDAKGDRIVIPFASNSSDKWIHTSLVSDNLPWLYTTDATFRLKEFGTRAYPLNPDRRCAFLHLLINMFHVRRWEEELPPNEGWWAPWHDHVGEMMKSERWGATASRLRRSTVLQMASTIGHIRDFGAEFKGGIEEPNDAGADTDAELDMLITNIVEEHLFPSPAVVFPDESKYERLVFGETDIVAEMQRRRAHFCAAGAPGATVKCVFAHGMTTYWSRRGSELNVHW